MGTPRQEVKTATCRLPDIKKTKTPDKRTLRFLFKYLSHEPRHARQLEIPTEASDSLLKITTFDGVTAPTGGTFYTHPILLEIGAKGHRTMISCEITTTGRYDSIIPLGWWHDEHPLKNIADPRKWVFEEAKCHTHIQDEAVADMFQWDDTVAYDEAAQYVGRIEREEAGGVQLETLAKPYWHYKELFEEKKAKMLAPRRAFNHAINLKEGANPPWGPIYPMSGHQLNKLDKYLKKMMAEGKIAHSESPYGAPILFVPKPDGSLRLCVDYRNLNKLTILNKNPLPLIDELRDRVAGAKVFTKLDLKDGYHLIRMRKGDEGKTAFHIRYGQYEYKVMPFGLVNAPTTFQSIMNKILREFLDHRVVVYLDDVLIYTENMKDHIKLVQMVLDRLVQHDLAVSLKKSVFHQQEVEFQGYLVKTSVVTMSDRKVKSVQNWAHPRSVKEVQIFIGLANLYRRFIKDFSKVCKPITETLKGNPKDFHWGREQEEGFEDLKKRLSTVPILSHFYPGRKQGLRQRQATLRLDAYYFNTRGDAFTQWLSIFEN